jgi:hypothetical protein
MNAKSALWLAAFAALAIYAGWRGYQEFFPTPESYVAKLGFSNKNVAFSPEGSVPVSFDIHNEGRKNLANVPVVVICTVNSETQQLSVDSGPIGSKQSVHIDSRVGPFSPTTMYVRPFCSWKITHVVFAP